MTTATVLRGTLPLRRRRHTREADAVKPLPNPSLPARIPQSARLMALAWHVDALVRSGTLSSYAAAARLGRISRARLSQILGLLYLAPTCKNNCCSSSIPAAVGRRQCCARCWPLRRRWTGTSSGGAGATSSAPTGNGGPLGPKHIVPGPCPNFWSIRRELPGVGGAVEVVLLP
jgi:hypothetical protein